MCSIIGIDMVGANWIFRKISNDKRLFDFVLKNNPFSNFINKKYCMCATYMVDGIKCETFKYERVAREMIRSDFENIKNIIMSPSSEKINCKFLITEVLSLLKAETKEKENYKYGRRILDILFYSEKNKGIEFIDRCIADAYSLNGISYEDAKIALRHTKNKNIIQALLGNPTVQIYLLEDEFANIAIVKINEINSQ